MSKVIPSNKQYFVRDQEGVFYPTTSQGDRVIHEDNFMSYYDAESYAKYLANINSEHQFEVWGLRPIKAFKAPPKQVAEFYWSTRETTWKEQHS